MEQHYPALFQPIHIGRLEIKNRLVVPAIGTLFWVPGGYVSDRLMEYLDARARGGFGLIIVEGTVVDPRGKGGPKQLCIWDESCIPGFRRLVERLHSAGAKVALQLMHAGRNTHPAIIDNQQPVAPSAIPDPVIRQVPKELTREEIGELVESFAQAARRTLEAGFDALEIHGGHGYLVAEFMSGYANKRTDDYGGSLEGFLRFPTEILRRTKELVGPDFPIIFRISADEAVPQGRTLEESVAVSRHLVAEGVHALHATIGVYESSYLTMAPPAMEQGFNVTAASVIKSGVSVPVIAVGRINDPQIAERIILSGKADMVAIGRQSLADPEWPIKAAENRTDTIVRCLSCNEGCLSSGWKAKAICCIQNPALGREATYASPPTPTPKNVLVAGGGPAGLEAARTAALRGHTVVLFEKGNSWGGQVTLAAIPPTKSIWKEVASSRIRALERLHVEIHLGKELTPQIVKELSPDVLIIATGSEPLFPEIPGINNSRVVPARDVLNGLPVGDRVVIIGGGLVGCETADHLAQQGKDVTIIEMLMNVAKHASPSARHFLLARLAEKKVKIYTSTTVKEIADKAVIICSKGTETTLAPVDNVILATGAKPLNPLEGAVQGFVPSIYTIGDAADPGGILDAVQQAVETALKL